MNISERMIEIGGMPIQIVWKDIKNLHVGVYPPHGRVRVAAPLRFKDETVRLAVISRLGWIRRQKEQFEKQERQSLRQYVTGESHYVHGRRYRLDVVEGAGPGKVRLRNNSILELCVRPESTREQREAILNRWYRARLQEVVPGILSKWEPRLGVSSASWSIRKMRTRWGTCNQQTGHILLNVELAKKPRMCLEFIVVHEMVHLLERQHNDQFRAHMNRLVPNWSTVRDELNRAPLGHAEWRY